ncbi:DsbA family protein [Haloarchaeobius sp. DFWS5]|uniref:DsbA family protein n=1 Tax=Haloarchaeobius sp. DFWS5 TaxID=3446114 RepID=UPI003EC0CACE
MDSRRFPRPTRRAALTTLGTTGLSALAGCAALGLGTTDSSNERSGAGGTDDSGAPTANGSSQSSSDESNSTTVRTSSQTTPLGVSLDGNPVQGSADAPVDLYYWSDFQCPFCKRFEVNTRPKLVQDAVAGGTVRLVYLELPNIGSASFRAAAHSKCVWRQVRDDDPSVYLDWHEAVFDAQEKPNSGWATKERLLGITESVDGVSRDAVASCLDGEKQSVKSSMRADVDRAKDHSIAVTPSFLFHDRDADETQTINGAQPYTRFASVVKSMTGE